MAGSYHHVVTDDGNLGSDEHVVSMLENGGDVFEAVEEMYGMIWWLANRTQANESAVDLVEAAVQNYRLGLEIARAANSGG